MIANFLAILIPVSVGKYFDLLFGFHTQRSKILNYLPQSWTNSTTSFLTFFGILLLLRLVFYLYYKITLRTQGEALIKFVKDKLFSHQLRVNQKIYADKGTDKYLLRYAGDITSLKNLFNSGTISFIIDIIISIIAIIWLVILNKTGGIAVIVSMLLTFLIIYFINKKIEFYALQKRNATSGQLSFVNQSFNGILSIIAFNKEYIEKKKFYKRTDKIFQNGQKYITWDTINKGLILFLQHFVLLIVFIIFYKDNLSIDIKQSGGDLISFIFLYITILPVFSRIFMIETTWRLGLISLKKLNGILGLSKSDSTTKEELITKNPRMELVDFSVNDSSLLQFSSSKSSLKSLQLPSDLDAFALIKCILLIDQSYNGDILINQSSIKNYSPKSIRNTIGVVSTRFPLLGTTVFEAIVNVRNTQSREMAENMLNNIQFAFNLSTPLTLDNYIGENGNQLSMIQKELLSLVRGLLLERKFLIIDMLPLLEKTNKTKLKEILSSLEISVIFLRSNIVKVELEEQ